jgi:hypothetical protein
VAVEWMSGPGEMVLRRGGEPLAVLEIASEIALFSLQRCPFHFANSETFLIKKCFLL